MVILCMNFYGLLSGIVLSHDNQNDIELVRFSVVCNVHSIINYGTVDEAIILINPLNVGGGVQAFHFGKNDFELGSGGDGQDTSRHFEGSFRSIRAILPM